MYNRIFINDESNILIFQLCHDLKRNYTFANTIKPVLRGHLLGQGKSGLLIQMAS